MCIKKEVGLSTFTRPMSYMSRYSEASATTASPLFMVRTGAAWTLVDNDIPSIRLAAVPWEIAGASGVCAVVGASC